MSKANGSQRHADGPRAVKWATRYGDLVRHVERTQEMPVEEGSNGDSSSTESLLAGWVRYQRRRHERGTLPPWQRVLLEQISKFSLAPLDDQWTKECAALDLFIARHGQLPRYRSKDTTERALAAWVYKQRHLYRSGQMSADRVVALRRLRFKIV